jgi:pimeloyl-ACP methyl ester carboxylesterase
VRRPSLPGFATQSSRGRCAPSSAQCLDDLATLEMPPVPTTVLVRTRFEIVELGDFETLLRSLELEWLDLLPGATRRPVDGAGHYIQRDRPDVVADEIRRLVRAAIAANS